MPYQQIKVISKTAVIVVVYTSPQFRIACSDYWAFVASFNCVYLKLGHIDNSIFLLTKNSLYDHKCHRYAFSFKGARIFLSPFLQESSEKVPFHLQIRVVRSYKTKE